MNWLKNKLAITVAGFVAVLCLSVSAHAGGSMKDDYVAPQFNWTGFYVGSHSGLTNGDTQGGVTNFGPIINALTAYDHNMTGANYGVHAGYNYQMGNTVLGIEGDFSGSSASGNTTCVIILNCKTELNWSASIVGRVGYAQGRTLYYVKGGAVWADLGNL